jgi:hypothetical protein
MIRVKTKNESAYALFAWLLFAALFVYLFLRAYYVEPIHDEVATFFHYIETGIYWGDKILLDANNHILNSYLSHKLFLLFGSNFFFLRLPNVLSFCLFFWALFQLVKPIKDILQRGILLVALSGIPFILEYFAYTRGYGISIAFFLASIVYLKRFANSLSLIYVFIAYLFLVVAVYANLTYLVSCVLAIGFVFIIQIISVKDLKWVKNGGILFFHFIFIYSILPAIAFAEKLKDGGALYYGTLEGFWEMTGKTLTDYTLFVDGSWFKWILLFVGLAIIAALIILWVRSGTKAFFKKNDTVVAWFLFGHIAAILFLAHFRDVNYPEDRVGMYLIPLSILLFAYTLNNHKWTSNGLFILLVFPILFLPRINLNTSAFSPQDRMSQEFYNQVILEITPKSTISAYHLMRLSWARFNRKEKTKNTISAEKNFNTAADIVLTRDVFKQTPSSLADYTQLTQDKKSGYIAYNRVKPFVKKVLFRNLFSVTESNKEFISFSNFTIPDSLRNRKLQIHIEGNTTTASAYTNASLVYSTFDKSHNSVVYESWGERWSHGLTNSYYLNFNYPIDTFEPNENEVRVYLWNTNKETIAIKNGKFEIISLE